jgi:hypothetical protein
MPDYRVYLLDSGGRIKGHKEFIGDCDDEALTRAYILFSELHEYASYEVWQQKRRVYPEVRH